MQQGKPCFPAAFWGILHSQAIVETRKLPRFERSPALGLHGAYHLCRAILLFDDFINITNKRLRIISDSKSLWGNNLEHAINAADDDNNRKSLPNA
jgi:hypothetical protein